MSGLLAALVFLSADPDAAERGRKNLVEKSYNPGVWSVSAYDNAWKQWDGVTAKPADYDAAFRDTYGLPPAPYPNHGLPMGLRRGFRLLGAGISVDCMVCHGGSIFGKSYVGLGNTSLDIQALFEDLSAADGIPFRTPFAFSRVRGTSEAGAMAVYLLGFREPDLSLRRQRLELGLHDDMIEDPPAWWHLKRKTRMYHDGGADARSVRSIMQFMMAPTNGPAAFKRAESDFRDILQYFLSIEAPKYPLNIDESKAETGRQLFTQHCARCHGTYGPDGRYPNKIVKLDEIGTDRKRFEGLEPRFGHYYNQTWFAREHEGWIADGSKAKYSDGYVAPPLDGVWATAPYFHNGSVPTLYGVLNSASRPKVYTRSFRTNLEDYDTTNIGWKVTPIGPRPGIRTPARERRKVYDTTQPGRGNGGHAYGDDLTDAQRYAVIEYLKTL